LLIRSAAKKLPPMSLDNNTLKSTSRLSAVSSPRH
jgi:hypothetical protein